METVLQIDSDVDIVYGSTPSRLASRTDEIMRMIADMGKACLHPFKALPFEYYEGGCVGRKKTIEVCCKLIVVCDAFAIFGISEGTLIELEYFLELNENLATPKPLLNFVKAFDPEWEKYARIYAERFPKAFLALNL